MMVMSSPLTSEMAFLQNGLHPFTDQEWDSLPHIILTSDTDWNPSVLDVDMDENEAWFDAITDLPPEKPPSAFDEFGDYNKRVMVHNHEVLYSWDTSQHVTDACIMVHTYHTQLLNQSCPTPSHPEEFNLDVLPTTYESQTHEINKRVPDYQALMPMFGWLPADVIQQTFAVTTQYTCLPMSTLLKKWYKSPFPALNVHRRDEPVAMDTIYSDTPTVDSGATIAQVFVGVESLVTDVYAIKTD